ncbi:MAG: hypothetical protein Q4F72_12675, partial [Desulfovibrionaceae bacterium]|nr:hypothetical protein [Desulfovibrionaceae bacterium]
MKVPGKGRSTVRTICQSIEAARKKHGNEFNYKYKSFCRALGRAKKVPAADKEFKSVHDNIEFLKTYFSSLGLDDRTVQRVCNPFSLAQLYTLIECEVDGFTSVSLAAHLENHWRMTEDGDGTGARCSRLPADCVRPFDGVLRKLLDRVAYELARETSEQLFARVPGRNTDIDMSVIIESNKFAFSASIADIKKNAFAQKKADEADKRQLARWQDKDERIRQAARGLCAYTGAQLGEDGEYDHIIPRSQTSGMGTVFNSEANLIYVSQKGNQLKGSRRYTLYDLDKGYLQAVFGTADTASVEGRIEETVLRLAETGDIRFFDRLKPEEQAAVRHALFLNASSEAFAAVVREINASNRTRVNGTQAYMVRAYREKICRLTADWCAANNNRLYFRNCWKVDAEQTSMLRTHLGEIDPALFKYEPQPIASHSIDAMCAYAVACGNAAACDLIGGDPDFSNAESYTADASLPTLHPGECKFINVRARDASQKTDFFAKPVFKEGILSENFLHILEKNGNVYVGFTVPGGSGDNGNCIQVAGKDPTQLLKDIEAYLDREV